MREADWARLNEIERAYEHCIATDRWPDNFLPFDAIRDLLRWQRAYNRSIVAHHDIANLSKEAIAESLGGPCQICAKAQR